MTQTILTLDSLSIAFNPQHPVVDNLNLSLHQGECLALVGESGSGKTLTALSIAQLLPESARLSEKSRIYFDGVELLSLPEKNMRALRGAKIGMIFQDAMSAFNPVKTIGQQLLEMRLLHIKEGRKTRTRACLHMLNQVGLPDPERIFRSYPHQLSGGMRQRAMIAMALTHHPKLLIADEPTTALDVTVQKQILELLNALRSEFGFSILYISHDLSVVSQLADHIAVLRHGKCLEHAPAESFFTSPTTAYAKQLLHSVLPLKPKKLRDITGSALLDIGEIHIEFKQAKKGFRRPPPLLAVHNVNLNIHQGETLALIGESGSGKTTLAKAIVNLIQPTHGTITYYTEHTRRTPAQMIFQDPYTAFNPRLRIGESLLEALEQNRQANRDSDKILKIRNLLSRVEIDPSRLWDYPQEFSGGERQRIAIARAFATASPLLVLDEPTSALDVCSQRYILELLSELQEETGTAYLLITHHMGIVSKIADRVAVMQNGCIVEQGSTEQVLANPQHAYTQFLLNSVLDIQPYNAYADVAEE